jgi:hypothetical protein
MSGGAALEAARAAMNYLFLAAAVLLPLLRQPNGR